MSESQTAYNCRTFWGTEKSEIKDFFKFLNAEENVIFVITKEHSGLWKSFIMEIILPVKDTTPRFILIVTVTLIIMSDCFDIQFCGLMSYYTNDMLFAYDNLNMIND